MRRRTVRRSRTRFETGQTERDPVGRPQYSREVSRCPHRHASKTNRHARSLRLQRISMPSRRVQRMRCGTGLREMPPPPRLNGALPSAPLLSRQTEPFAAGMQSPTRRSGSQTRKRGRVGSRELLPLGCRRVCDSDRSVLFDGREAARTDSALKLHTRRQPAGEQIDDESVQCSALSLSAAAAQQLAQLRDRNDATRYGSNRLCHLGLRYLPPGRRRGVDIDIAVGRTEISASHLPTAYRSAGSCERRSLLLHARKRTRKLTSPRGRCPAIPATTAQTAACASAREMLCMRHERTRARR